MYFDIFLITKRIFLNLKRIFLISPFLSISIPQRAKMMIYHRSVSVIFSRLYTSF